MSQPTFEGREIDSRLEELDRRLRAVQEDLLPEGEPRPVRDGEAVSPPEPPEPPAPPEPPEPPPPAPDPPPPPPAPPPPPRAERPPPPPRPAAPPSPAGVTTVHSKLVSSLRELLGAYEELLDQFPSADPPRSAPAQPEPPTISAGPFENTDAVRAFRDVLARLPDVETVVVRAYEGEDRAIFDVKLTEPQLADGSA
jgi:outer membrane biosynthesis protein TonB